jgi:hypothetical protein
MGFELGEKRSYWELLMTPGPIVTIIGLIILTISVIVFATSGSADPDMVDALIESKENNGLRIKAMIGLVAGTLVSVGGVLLSLMTFSRS